MTNTTKTAYDAAAIAALFVEWSDGVQPHEADDEQTDEFLAHHIPADADKRAFRETFETLLEQPEPDEEEREVHSVVGAKYKARYAERAATMRKPKDVPVKALKRSTNDWLAIELAKRTLDKKAHLSVPAFEAILDANGVKHSHWNRTTPGWQGRLRMTGRLALARVVAENGELKLPEAEAIPAPKSWVAKHLN